MTAPRSWLGIDPARCRINSDTPQVWTTRVKDRPRCRIRDLPASGQRVELWCRKRRLLCGERLCPRRSFTQHTIQLPARARVTTRLRAKVAEAIAISNRALTEVGREYGVGWHTAHQALVAAAAKWLPEPDPTPVLGIDETRARRVRWILEEAGWKRCDPWLTSVVDARPDAPGRLLGLAPGRSGQCVKDWLGEQTPQFRHAVEVVVIDPCAPYASGVPAALPQARIAVDHWHLVRLANQMVTDVRQPVTRQHHGPAQTQGRRRLGAPAPAVDRRGPAQRQAADSPEPGVRPGRPDRRPAAYGSLPADVPRVLAVVATLAEMERVLVSVRFSSCQMVPGLVQPFWAALQAGEFLTDAAAVAETHRWRGLRWLREAGGVRPRCGRDLPGRYLWFAEREEIALGRAAGESVWSIAVRLGCSPSTVSRELRRNADRKGGYRAMAAHALAYGGASRPKPAKLATNLALRRRVEHDLEKRYSPEQIAGRLRQQYPEDPPDVGVDRDDLPVAVRAVPRRAAP